MPETHVELKRHMTESFKAALRDHARDTGRCAIRAAVEAYLCRCYWLSELTITSRETLLDAVHRSAHAGLRAIVGETRLRRDHVYESSRNHTAALVLSLLGFTAESAFIRRYFILLEADEMARRAMHVVIR